MLSPALSSYRRPTWRNSLPQAPVAVMPASYSQNMPWTPEQVGQNQQRLKDAGFGADDTGSNAGFKVDKNWGPNSQRAQEGYNAEQAGANAHLAPYSATANQLPKQLTGLSNVTAAPGPQSVSGMQKMGAYVERLGNTGLVNGVVSGTEKAGKAIWENPAATASILQGVGGLISYATARAPKPLAAPRPFTPIIRGAQGMEASSYQQARNDIQTAQSIASQPGSADASSSAVQRLLAGREAMRATTALGQANNAAYQTDLGRVDQQTNAAYQTNYQNQRQFEEKTYDEQNRQYQARRTQGAAMLQGGVDSLAAIQAEKHQSQQVTLEAQNRQKESQIASIRTELSNVNNTREITDQLLAKLRELDNNGDIYNLARQRYAPVQSKAAGGTIQSGAIEYSAPKAAKASATSRKVGRATGGAGTRGLPPSVASVHEMSKDFNRQLTQFSNNARAAFDRAITRATGLRSVGYGPSRSR